jgi:CubicO group peptidase (beta-lactamase class C family)
MDIGVNLAADASPRFRDVADALVIAMREFRIPGAALGILADGTEEHATFGQASLASQRPVTPETLFQIASVTKTYTATAIWRLIDRGALALAAPVRRYLPDLLLADESTAASVTVANLLEHTSGWFSDEVFDDGDDDEALSRFVDQRLPGQPQLFRCGEMFSYSNSAFQLLGRLIEVTTGTTFHAALDRLLFDPLGVHDTTLDRAAVLGRLYADGHTAMPVNGQDAVLVQTPVWLPRCVDPAGGIWSTTRDVLRYARIHLGDSPDGVAEFVKPASLRTMQEPAVAVPGLGLHMGRSWFVQEVGDLRVISHNGDTSGQHAVLLAVPERRFAFVVLLNGQPGAAAALAALDAALAGYPGLAALSGRVGLMRSLLAPADLETIELSREQLQAYEGRYVDPGQITTFRFAGESLEKVSELTPAPGAWRPAFASPPAEPIKVRFAEPDLAVAGGVRIPFVRRADGSIGWMADGLRLRPRV